MLLPLCKQTCCVCNSYCVNLILLYTRVQFPHSTQCSAEHFLTQDRGNVGFLDRRSVVKALHAGDLNLSKRLPHTQQLCITMAEGKMKAIICILCAQAHECCPRYPLLTTAHVYRQIWLAIANCDEEFDECLIDYRTECARMANLILAAQVRSNSLKLLCAHAVIKQPCEGTHCLATLKLRLVHAMLRLAACITCSASWHT